MKSLSLAPPRWNWPWPLPALAAWALGWGLFALLARFGLGAGAAALAATAFCAACALACGSAMRRAVVALGFPLSLAAAGLGGGWPAWLWLLPLGLGLLAYPLRAWRDAPLFPTPAAALRPLAQRLPLPAGARVLDAGCGLGHGLQALRRAYPAAQLEGVEHSLLLAWACRARCPWARVQRGDLWAQDWSAFALVYMFQRPESMARAMHKARRELAAGSWLVSLEFEVPGQAPTLQLQCADGRPLWLYRIARPGPTQEEVGPADKAAIKA